MRGTPTARSSDGTGTHQTLHVQVTLHQDPAYPSHVSVSVLRIEKGMPTREIVIQDRIPAVPPDPSEQDVLDALGHLLHLAKKHLP